MPIRANLVVRLFAGAFAFLALGTQAKAATILIDIDSFNDGSVDIAANSGSPSATNTQTGLSGVLGGRRTSTASFIGGINSTRTQVSSGLGALSTDTGNEGTATFRYGNQASGGSNLNQNFLNPTADSTGQGIEIYVTQSNPGTSPGGGGPGGGVPNKITVTLYTQGVGSSSYDLVLTGNIVNTVYNIPFSSFSPGADLNDIDGITVGLGSNSNGISPDIGLNYVSVYGTQIPEPTSVAVFGAVAAAGFFYRRRKNVQVTA